MLVGIVRMILSTSTGEIGRSKLTEEEELCFDRDFSVDCIFTSSVVKIDEHLPFCWEFCIFFIEVRVAVDHVVRL